MMSLRELIDAVEAGRTPEAHEITSALRPLYDGEEPIVAYVRMACDAADLRAVGAALALMQAVLPGWTFTLIQNVYSKAFIAHVSLARNGEVIEDAGGSSKDNPARALLLAILRAMEGETP